MKKILILVMSCNDEFFKQQVEKIKQTWAKPILDGKYSNIDFMSYDGWDAQHYYDKDNKCIHIRCEDNLDNTYKKTFYALSIIKHIHHIYLYLEGRNLKNLSIHHDYSSISFPLLYLYQDSPQKSS